MIGCGGLIGLLSVVSAVGEHAFQPGEALAQLVQQQGRAVTILDRGRMHDKADWQPQRVHQGMDLAPFHLLACVISHCVGLVGG